MYNKWTSDRFTCDDQQRFVCQSKWAYKRQLHYHNSSSGQIVLIMFCAMHASVAINAYKISTLKIIY